MQKYLLNVRIDVADEDDAVLLTVINGDTYNKIKNSRVAATWGQIELDEDDYMPFKDFSSCSWRSDTLIVIPITDAEAEMLERLNVYAKAGRIYFIDENGEDIDID